jgi:hypothetical protein
VTEFGALDYVQLTLVVLAGQWPFRPTRPTPSRLGLDGTHFDFAGTLREALATYLAGLLAREPATG